MAAHETFQHDHEVKGSSDRNFGLVFAAALLLAGLAPLRRHQHVRLWALAASAAFLLAALLAPKVLRPLNRAWTEFGLLLQRITTPVVMGVLFYILFTPMGLLLRAMGKDLLGRRPDPGFQTYWNRREPAGPLTETMQQQF